MMNINLALRHVAGANPEPPQVVERAYRLALGRSPDTQERDALLTYLQRELRLLREEQSSKDTCSPMPLPASSDPVYGSIVASLCHALLNLNEFLYVD